MYKAKITVTLRQSILDPQGKATQHALSELGFANISKVRMGKYIELWIDATGEHEANEAVEAACDKLLANPVMEDYSFAIEAVEAVV